MPASKNPSALSSEKNLTTGSGRYRGLVDPGVAMIRFPRVQDALVGPNTRHDQRIQRSAAQKLPSRKPPRVSGPMGCFWTFSSVYAPPQAL